MKKILMSASLLAASLSAQAVETAVGLTAGTFGAGAEVTFGINENISVRGLFTTYDYDETLDADDVDYKANLELGGFGVMFDYHPFGGKFRLSTGLLKNNLEVTGSANPTAAIQIGDNAADTFGGTAGDRIDLSINPGGTVPYFGIGFGSAASEGMPFGFGVDLGVMPMSPDIDVKLVGDISSIAVLQTAIDQEEENIRKDLSEFELWPVLQLKASYRF